MNFKKRIINMFFKMLWLILMKLDMRIFQMLINHNLIPFFIFKTLIAFAVQITIRQIASGLSE
jgi:hypothetical protein